MRDFALGIITATALIFGSIYVGHETAPTKIVRIDSTQQTAQIPNFADVVKQYAAYTNVKIKMPTIKGIE